MKFSLENQGGNTFLTCEVSPSDQMDDIALAMLSSNKIPGLAPIAYSQINGVSVIRYNISSRMQAKRLMSGMVNKNVLLGIFRSVCQAFSAVGDYMIPTEMLLLDLEYIYVDTVTYDGVLICLPTVQDGTAHTDLRGFFRTVLFSVTLDKTDGESYFIDIVNYLNSTENFSVERFLEVLNTADNPEPQQTTPETHIPSRKKPDSSNVERATAEIPQQPEKKEHKVESKTPPTRQDDYVYEGINIPGHARSTPAEVDSLEDEGEASQKISVLYLLRHFDKDTVNAYKEQQQATKKKKKKEKKSASSQAEEADFVSPFHQEPAPKSEPPHQKKAKADVRPETVGTKFTPQYESDNTMDSDETVIDETSGETSQENASAYLVRVASQERIYIDTPMFCIGRSEVESDYCIAGNKKVSRKHAKIISRNEKHFLMDVGSNNHTYVNGDLIASNIEVELQDGDKIRFANEKFEFFLIERPASPYGAD